MRRIIAIAMAMIAFAALAPAGYAVTIDPIPGNLTYPEQRKLKPAPQTRATGSVVHHRSQQGYPRRQPRTIISGHGTNAVQHDGRR